MVYDAVTENNDTTTTQMDPEGIVLSEIQQTEKERPMMSLVHRNYENITSEQTQQKGTHPKNMLVVVRWEKDRGMSTKVRKIKEY